MKLQIWAVMEYINSYTSILVSSWYNSDSDSLFLLFLSSPRISFVDEHILLVRLILAHLSWNNHKWISEIKNRAPNALGDRRKLMNITRFDLNQFNSKVMLFRHLCALSICNQCFKNLGVFPTLIKIRAASNLKVPSITILS